MFSLLFDTSFWYDVLTVVAIIAVIYILIKFPHAKIYVFSILFALITATGIYSIININSYYSASGGIYGILTGNFDENNQLYVNEKTFELKNTILTQKNGDTYSAKSISDEIFKINTNEYLGVFVNGSPCTYSKIEEDYFVAYYNYNFYGRDNNVLFNDTLKMYFSFYDKSTQLEVMTDGGSEAVKYWGYYFNNNDFNVTLKSVKTAYDKELTIGEGDISNYVVVKYYLDDIEVAKQVCLKGSTITFPTLNDGKYYKWKLKDSENYIDSSFIVTDNLSINGEESDTVWTAIFEGKTSIWCANYVADFDILGLKANKDFQLTIDYLTTQSVYGDTYYGWSDGSTTTSYKNGIEPWVVTSGNACRVWSSGDYYAQYEFSCVKDNVLHISLVTNYGANVVPGDVILSKVEILLNEPINNYALTIHPCDFDENGNITFSVDKVVLTNDHRFFTFAYKIKEGYSLEDYIAAADGLFTYKVRSASGTSGVSGFVTIELCEDLTETIKDDYYINFYTEA